MIPNFSNQTVYIHEYTLFPRARVEIQVNKFPSELLIASYIETDKKLII